MVTNLSHVLLSRGLSTSGQKIVGSKLTSWLLPSYFVWNPSIFSVMLWSFLVGECYLGNKEKIYLYINLKSEFWLWFTNVIYLGGFWLHNESTSYLTSFVLLQAIWFIENSYFLSFCKISNISTTFSPGKKGKNCNEEQNIYL